MAMSLTCMRVVIPRCSLHFHFLMAQPTFHLMVHHVEKFCGAVGCLSMCMSCPKSGSGVFFLQGVSGWWWTPFVYRQWMMCQWDGYAAEWCVGGEKFLISMYTCTLGNASGDLPFKSWCCWSCTNLDFVDDATLWTAPTLASQRSWCKFLMCQWRGGDNGMFSEWGCWWWVLKVVLDGASSNPCLVNCLKN